MNKLNFSSVSLMVAVFIMVSGCSEESDNDDMSISELSDETGITVDGAWARPASEGRTSAAYFLITNFGEAADSLLAVETDVSQNAEIHESYEREENMMGMREIGKVEIPGQSTMRFEQGGLHVMLIQLNRQLRDGDTFELTLLFKENGERTVEIPVRL